MGNFCIFFFNKSPIQKQLAPPRAPLYYFFTLKKSREQKEIIFLQIIYGKNIVFTQKHTFYTKTYFTLIFSLSKKINSTIYESKKHFILLGRRLKYKIRFFIEIIFFTFYTENFTGFFVGQNLKYFFQKIYQPKYALPSLPAALY